MLAVDDWFVLKEKYCWSVAHNPHQHRASWQTYPERSKQRVYIKFTRVAQVQQLALEYSAIVAMGTRACMLQCMPMHHPSLLASHACFPRALPCMRACYLKLPCRARAACACRRPAGDSSPILSLPQLPQRNATLVYDAFYPPKVLGPTYLQPAS